MICSGLSCVGPRLALCCVAATLWASTVAANDFPTQDRVLFVEECMALENSRKYQTLYACSCTLDMIAAQMSYDEYVEADSYTRMRNMRGERGGLFRDNDDRARSVRKRFQELKTQAHNRCFPRQPGPS